MVLMVHIFTLQKVDVHYLTVANLLGCNERQVIERVKKVRSLVRESKGNDEGEPSTKKSKARQTPPAKKARKTTRATPVRQALKTLKCKAADLDETEVDKEVNDDEEEVGVSSNFL